MAHAGGEPKMILEKMESMQNERQISVDPISVRQSADNNNMLTTLYPLTTLPPLANGKFISCSLPNSATSSPRFELTSAKHKKKHKNQQQPLSRQQSVALGNLERLRENRMQRSKSCGEGRACQPSVDFDLWSPGSGNEQGDNESDAEKREEGKIRFQKKVGDEAEDKFKCGACLFLPGLGKGKTVRARKEAEAEAEHIDVVSQRASLEKFECGSWRSSALINHEEDGDATSNLFFDLPLELMGCSSVNDTESPVTTGFVFDNKDHHHHHHHHHHRKGVLKSTTTCSGQLGKSHESFNSPRHVRFSTSSPSSPCITPRLRKARDDFSAFLEAQSA